MTESLLLERDEELRVVDRALADARAGEGKLLLIEGPAGIGKTRVLAEVRARAERMRVLAARAGELEQSFPFGVVRQLFESLTADPELAGAFEGAAGPARGALSLPGDQPADGAGTDSSFAVLHGLYWLVLNLAEERPLLISVDDLHWCDRPSLRFLAYLTRRLEGAPVLLATTLRTGEPGADPLLLADIAGDPAALPLRPRPLSSAATVELIADRLGEQPDTAFRAACHESTGGNPLLLGQLLAALRDDGVAPVAANARKVREVAPRAVSRAMLLRLARLSPDAVSVARAVAILGESARIPTVAALSALDEASVANAIGDLVRVDILRSEPPLDFVHPLVRAAVYHDLPPGERDLAHARAAAVLAESDVPIEQVAGQLLHAPARGDVWVCDTLRAAAASAVQRGAPDGAVDYLRRALDEPPPPDQRVPVLVELGGTEAWTSGPGAAEHLGMAYDAIEDPVQRAEVAAALVRTLLFTGDVNEAAALTVRAAETLPPELTAEHRHLEALRYMSVWFGAGEPADIEGLTVHHDPPGPDADYSEKMLAGLAALQWTYSGGSARECAALAIASLAGGDLVAADPALLAIAAIATLALADRNEVLESWEQVRAEAHRTGSLLIYSTINLWHGFTVLRRGDLGTAVAELRQAMEDFDRWGFGGSALGYRAGFLATALAERGEVEEARVICDRMVDPGVDSLGTLYWLQGRAAVELAAGDAEAALAVTEELRRRSAWVKAPIDSMWHLSMARALDQLDRGEEALPIAREGLEISRAWGGPFALGAALRVVGSLEREQGLDHLRESIAVLEASPARLELAKSLAAYGAALRRARQPTEAREPLRRALELASACDAAPLAEHTRTELHATGARPRTDALAGVEALTPSERRVVDLAAGGQANREIAQVLYVTPKTVEVHLTNAYRKLGIRSRRELTGALETPGAA